MTDFLGDLPVERVAAWYGRLADAWKQGTPELKPPLAGSFLKAWLRNRSSLAKIEFEAPLHLRSNFAVIETASYHREVFLTNKMARIGSGEKWAGIIPRVQGMTGFNKWNMKRPLNLEYESLCDIAPTKLAIIKVQRSGSNADRDIFGSLRGFQLKSTVTVAAQTNRPNTQVRILFNRWQCSGTDRYDWDYSEHMTVANPDYMSKDTNDVRPQDQKVTVYHSNAKRLEDARLAAPYDVFLRPWPMSASQLISPAAINIGRRL